MFLAKKNGIRILSSIIIAFLIVSMLAVNANNIYVDPPSVEETLFPGEYIEVEKEVMNPPLPQRLDLLLLEDETGSFGDDIAIMKGNLSDSTNGLAAAIWDGIDAEVDDFMGGVAGFRDFDQDFWGDTGDHVYRLLQDLTDDKTTWLQGIGNLTAGGGADLPEAQLAALKSAADGVAWDSNGDGDFDDDNDTPLDQNPNWRDDATSVVMLVTDATYHVFNDSGGWPGPTYNDTIQELNAAGVHVIILATSDLVTSYSGLANETGGAVKQISDDSSDIVDAVLEALEEILTDVWWTVECDDGLDVTLSPAVHMDIPGNVTVFFNETIMVPNATEPGMYYCNVTFMANEYPEEGAVIGVETICIEVEPIPVEIDIKPGSYPNSINTKSKGVIPVALLGGEDLDVATVNTSTLEFGPWGASPVHVAMEDVNSDGFMDLISHYLTQETGIAPGDTEACLTGKFMDDKTFQGCDSVRTVK
jgi:hypothetical protein